MSTPNAYELVLFPERNLVRMLYLGSVNAEHVLRAGQEIELLLVKVPTGFTMLVDLTSLERMDVECGPLLGRIMDICRKAGIGRVIRVMPDRHKDIGLNILSLIHYRGKIPIMTYQTLAEAEKELG